MNAYRIRRATTEDLEQLVSLWQSLQMPALELEKVFTDFQVAEDAEHKLVGAIAMQIDGTEGRIHSETIPDFALSDVLRPLFWDRLLSVARNHGLFRVWTEEAAPFWKKDVGFIESSNERLKELPQSFGRPHHGWLVIQLRKDEASPAALEKQLEVILAAQAIERSATRRQAESWARQGKALKSAATVFCLLLFIFSLIILFMVWRGR